MAFTIPDRFAGDNFDVNSAVTNTTGGASNVAIVDGLDGDGVDDTIQYDVNSSSSVSETTLGINFSFTAPDVDSDTNVPVRFTLEDSDGDDVDITRDTVLIENDATQDAFNGPANVLNTSFDSNKTFEQIRFQGQIVVSEGFDSNEKVNVRRDTDNGDQLVREETANNLG